MRQFRKASTKEQLNKAVSFKFDKNFFNYYDMDVLNAYASKKGSKLWEKTHGFDYCTSIGWKNSTKCSLKCLKAERSKFAKDCQKKGGLFKCCLMMLNIMEFEDFNRDNYRKMGLKEKPAKLCTDKTTNVTNPCYFCCVTYCLLYTSDAADE